jgi:signal transduction histidine kinase
MIIRDNGKPAPGKEKLNGKKSGQGLANLAMRAQRIKADLDIDQGEEGYTVRLRRKRFA